MLHRLMLNFFLRRIVMSMRRDVNTVARATLNRSGVRERNDMELTNTQGYQIIASLSIINLSHSATTLHLLSDILRSNLEALLDFELPHPHLLRFG